MKRLFYSVPMIVALLLASCTKEMRFQEPPLADGDKVPVALTCEPLDFELEEGTKSHLGNNILTKVSNVNYYLFDKEGNFVSQGYTEDLGEFGIALPDIDAHYQCFFFANVGRFQLPETTKASEMGTAVHYDFNNYENYSTSIENNGFPMAAGVADFNKVNAGNVTVKRLVHTLRVKINTAALNASHLHVKNVRVRQAPRDFFPFAEKSKLTTQFDDQDILETGADWLSAEEVEKINNGEEVRLYILENMRGELIPGNTEWKNKTPQNIENRPEASKATYIEIETWVVTPTANYDNVVYRAYLGKSPSNFDVQRSTSFLLTNVFTSDMIPDEDWRIDPGEPVIKASLGFVWPDNDLDWSEYLEEDGFGKNVYVNNPDHMIPALEDTNDGPHCPMCQIEGVSNFETVGDAMRCKVCGYEDQASNFINFSNVDSFYLTDGFKQVLYIYRSAKNVYYTLSKAEGSSDVPKIQYTVTKYSDKIDKVVFWTPSSDWATYSDTKDEYGFPYLSNGDITGCIGDTPRKVYPVKFKIETPDGLLSQVITCNYFYGPMGCNIYTDESNGALRLSCGNPLQLYVSTTCGGAFETVMPGLKEGYVSHYKLGNDDWYTAVPGKNFYSTDVTMPYFQPGGLSASSIHVLVMSAVAGIATAGAVALSFINPITGGLAAAEGTAIAASLFSGVMGTLGGVGLFGISTAVIESYQESFDYLSNRDYRPFQIVRVPFRRHSYNKYQGGSTPVWIGCGVPRNYVNRNQTGASLEIDFGMRSSVSFSSNYFDQAPSKTVSWSLAESYQKAKNFSITNTLLPAKPTRYSIPFAADLHYSLILGHWVMDSFEYSIKNGICEKIAGHPEEGTEQIRSYGMDVLSKQRGLIINNDGTSDSYWHTSQWWETSSKYVNIDLIKNVWKKSENLFTDITPYINDMYGASIYAIDKNGNKFYFDGADYREEDSWFPSSAIGYVRKVDKGIESGSILDTKRFCHLMGIGGTPKVANKNGVLGLCREISGTSEVTQLANAIKSGSSALLNFVAIDGEEIQAPENPIIIYKNGSSYGAINMKEFLSTRTNELPGHLSSHPITIGCNESFFAENAAY